MGRGLENLERESDLPGIKYLYRSNRMSVCLFACITIFKGRYLYIKRDRTFEMSFKKKTFFIIYVAMTMWQILRANHVKYSLWNNLFAMAVNFVIYGYNKLRQNMLSSANGYRIYVDIWTVDFISLIIWSLFTSSLFI